MAENYRLAIPDACSMEGLSIEQARSIAREYLAREGVDYYCAAELKNTTLIKEYFYKKCDGHELLLAQIDYFEGDKTPTEY